MHNGRSRTINEVILWHGGKAATSKIFFSRRKNVSYWNC
ncbi:di-heme oxidoredictase family protein [Neptunomonas qingdaonensis]